MSLHVLIAGGGLGGLCLAQGLQKAGVRVDVYERDASLTARGQGYRLRIDSDGNRALEECLPPNLYALYRATANRSSPPPIGAFDCRLNLIYRLPASDSGGQPSDSHLAVNRLTLRQVLFGGLDDMVHFNHTLTAFERGAEGVRARFANGQAVEGDVLVAADGIHSAVRRQLLPQAEIIETDMRCIYGKTPLTGDILEGIPEPLFNGFTPTLGPDRCTLAFGMYRPLRPLAEVAAEFAPALRLDPQPDYLLWIFVFPKERYPLEESAEAPRPPAVLHRFVLERTRDWLPELRRLLELADIPSISATPICSSRPVSPWPASRVTLLGDAIHAMTPAGGIGANIALRDAAALTQALIAVHRNDLELIATIARYESAMRGYGFAAVERSLQGAAQLYRISIPRTEASL